MQSFKRHFPSTRIGFPVAAAFQIHRTELPPFGRIADVALELHSLLFVRDRGLILDDLSAEACQHLFELGRGAKELFVFLADTETRHVPDASMAISAVVEQDGLASGGQMRHVALEVLLHTFAAGESG